MTDFVPSAGQQQAVEMVGRFLQQEDVRVAVITGFAGTGKTTLIRILAEKYGEPTVLAPTGKAALRVGEATGIFGMTIHRWCYEPSEDPKTGAPIFKLKDWWDEAFSDMTDKVVLVDESSMLSEDVWRDLRLLSRKIGFYVILMGDTFQLPPVTKGTEVSSFSALTSVETPFRVELTEVVRQALDSPIIRASMLLRAGRPEREALDLLEPVGADKLLDYAIPTDGLDATVLCFTNARRHQINRQARESLGYSEETVEKAEPLLVVQNNYNLGVYNGEVIDFGGWSYLPAAETPVVDRFTASALNMHFGVGSCAATGRFTLSPEQVSGRSEDARVGHRAVRKAACGWYKSEFDTDEEPPHLDANYGYGLTVHKAQGSEWNEVLIVFDQSLRVLRGRERARWLYTAATRGKKKTSYAYVE